MHGVRKSWVYCVTGLAVFAVLSCNSPDVAEAAKRAPVDPMTSTFRIKAATSRGNSTITGRGTAFAVDLSEFGYPKKRYVMTACHVIRDHRGQMHKMFTIEFKQGGAVRWLPCRVLATDVKMDVALLECSVDLPVRASFAPKDAARGTSLTMVGSPAGVPLRKFKGAVREISRTGHSVARVEYIREGCSGGPIFDASTRTIIGLVVAGIGNGKDGEMDPNTCLFVTRTRLLGFLKTAMRSSKNWTSSRGVASAPPRARAKRVSACPPCEPCRPIFTGGVMVDRSGMWLP